MAAARTLKLFTCRALLRLPHGLRLLLRQRRIERVVQSAGGYRQSMPVLSAWTASTGQYITRPTLTPSAWER